MKTEDTKVILFDLFREETLILAGLCTVYDVPNDFIHKTMKNLEVLMERYIRRFDQQMKSSVLEVQPKRSGVPHPAVAEMLDVIERLRKESIQNVHNGERVAL